jgi:hypothetical protein
MPGVLGDSNEESPMGLLLVIAAGALNGRYVVLFRWKKGGR